MSGVPVFDPARGSIFETRRVGDRRSAIKAFLENAPAAQVNERLDYPGAIC
jgi:hypothetical protein